MRAIREAVTPADVAAVRELFAEYVRAVDAPCCFVDFERELAALPEGYESLLLADGRGCVALRRIDAATAELKRLYVRPSHRGTGLGRGLLEAAIAVARERGYRRVVLDTLPSMAEAHGLYQRFRFREIPPYLAAPTPGATCFELSL
ncbi:MAG TPA: GNAT family N-acetyltransferase [Burkholderiales bacterium]|nr:GNAT family N-acetyltransferase [Burkholderiales bacterium]